MKKIINILSLLFFIAALTFSVYFFNQKNSNQAPLVTKESIKPLELQVTSTNISWRTTAPVFGYVIWGANPKDLSNTAADNSSFIKSISHGINLSGTPDHFYYKINSNDTIFGNPQSGEAFEFIKQ